MLAAGEIPQGGSPCSAGWTAQPGGHSPLHRCRAPSPLSGHGPIPHPEHGRVLHDLNAAHDSLGRRHVEAERCVDRLGPHAQSREELCRCSATMCPGALAESVDDVDGRLSCCLVERNSALHQHGEVVRVGARFRGGQSGAAAGDRGRLQGPGRLVLDCSGAAVGVCSSRRSCRRIGRGGGVGARLRGRCRLGARLAGGQGSLVRVPSGRVHRRSGTAQPASGGEELGVGRLRGRAVAVDGIPRRNSRLHGGIGHHLERRLRLDGSAHDAAVLLAGDILA
mmetsp:Transcript_12259/g.47319  ORF Transcript_12259/g.47319 Transcript_12259/m.47319 type:complete len:280 (-) Transcript_12259:454-1293(-)